MDRMLVEKMVLWLEILLGDQWVVKSADLRAGMMVWLTAALMELWWVP